jgi:lauroyl/myristoyl acyltransferase
MASGAGRIWRRVALAFWIVYGAAAGLVIWVVKKRDRRRATRSARKLLTDHGPVSRAKWLGLRQTIEARIDWQVSEHHRVLRACRVVGAEHLPRDAAAVIVTAHLYSVVCLPYILAVHGITTVSVAGGFFRDRVTKHAKRVTQMEPAMLEMADARWIYAGTGAFAQLREHVAAGGVGVVTLDVPGSREVRYVSKRTRIGQASSVIPYELGCPVIPAFVVRRGLSLHVEVHPAIRPSDFASVDDLAQAVASGVSAQLERHLGGLHPVIADVLWPKAGVEAAKPNRETWSPPVASME